MWCQEGLRACINQPIRHMALLSSGQKPRVEETACDEDMYCANMRIFGSISRSQLHRRTNALTLAQACMYADLRGWGDELGPWRTKPIETSTISRASAPEIRGTCFRLSKVSEMPAQHLINEGGESAAMTSGARAPAEGSERRGVPPPWWRLEKG